MAERAPRIACPDCGARVTVRKARSRNNPDADYRQLTRHYASSQGKTCSASGRRMDEFPAESPPVNGTLTPVVYSLPMVPVLKRERPLEIMRQYRPEDAGKDGYPANWHNIDGSGRGIKHLVRAEAGDRCVRCGHPYTQGDGQWSRCDDLCTHDLICTRIQGGRREAEWRVLTVHHLDEDKLNCRWWNLAALCQRDHLLIQRKVVMARPWPWPHTEWFKPYVAGYYAWKYAHVDITREQALEQLDSWLELGMKSEAVERMPL